MPNSNLKKVFRLTASVGVLAGMLTIFGCGSGNRAPEPVSVAQSDISVPVAANTAQSLEGLTFAFANGSAITSPASGGCDPACPSLATQPITLTFTDTSAAQPTATITAPNVVGTDGQPARMSGTTVFGSCTFRVALSTFLPGSGPQVGNTITVNPCQFNVKTGGVQANGQATTVQILLQLGANPSAAQQSTVSINPTTGVVTINNFTLPAGVGSVTLVVVTGAG